MLAGLIGACHGLRRYSPGGVSPGKGLRRGTAALVDLVFPPRCAWCRLEMTAAPIHALLCESCRRQFVGANGPRCVRCGATTAVESAASATACAACHGARLRFDSVFPLGDHRGQLRQAVLRMKRAREEPLSLAIGDLLFAQREAQLTALEADVVAPVPMHWSRRLFRGANSPELVAAALSRRLRIPLARRALVRRRNTRQQGSLLRGQRFVNIRGVFGLGAGYDLSGAGVLLVDDVMTTGATCSEAAATLRRGGAARVAVAVIARSTSGV